MIDGRTKAGQELEIINRVNNHGGFSIFWITANQKRACAGMRLQESGRMEVTPKGYPWSDAIILPEPTKEMDK